MDEFITHIRSGLRVNPATGKVIGRSGRQIGSAGTSGYIAVGWKEGNRIQGARVHRLVWEVANGPVPDGKEINHIDGNKANNCLSNLEAITRRENIRHAYSIGLNQSIGGGNGRAKLTLGQVHEIILRHASGESAYGLARKFGVGETAIRNIVQGKRWRKARAA